MTALAIAPDGMTAAVTGRKGPQVLIWLLGGMEDRGIKWSEDRGIDDWRVVVSET